MDTENAKDHRPPHGGYPPALSRRRRRGLATGVIINNVAPPSAPGFGPGHVQEAYELGKRNGRAGR